MARDTLTPVALTRDAGVNGKAATVMTAITVLNGAQIDVNDIDTSKLIIHVKNTHGAAHNVTVKAGVYSRAVLGDVVFEVAATTGEALFTVESSRCKQADGFLYIDFVTDTTGLIGCYLLP